MASTFAPAHPIPIVATQAAVVQQTYAHAYDEKPDVEDEKDGESADVEVGAVEVAGDVIRESGRLFLVDSSRI